MNSKQWQYFLTVAQLGSLQAASKRLGISRTTLSSSLAAMEDELNAQLFSRTGNQLQLSQLGQSLLPLCQRLVKQELQIRQLCQVQQRGQQIRLRLGRDDALPEHFWRSCFRRLQQSFPNLQLMVTVLASPELPNCLANEQIDLALCMLPQAVEELGLPQLGYQQLGWVQELMVCHPEHPLAQLSQVLESDLAQEQQISLAFLQQQGLQVWRPMADRFLALGLYELMRDAVLENMGWGRLPLPLIAPAMAAGQLQLLKYQQAKQMSPYWMLHHAQQSNPVAEQLQGLISDYLLQF